MKKEEILNKTDHTILTPTATWTDVKQACDDAEAFSCASVCIPPCYVWQAKNYVQSNLKICTVIGFPLGYQSLFVKKEEALQALRDGADELDVVININQLKSHNFDYVKEELLQIKTACNVLWGSMGKEPPLILKAIIETCLLSKEEIVRVCRIIEDIGFTYVKTSTGFSNGGATEEVVRIIKENISDNVRIKASGGISSFEEAEKFIVLGCERIGASRLVKEYKGE